MRAARAAGAPESSVMPVSAKLPVGKDLDRLCGEPPVHQVEMMRGFMDEQRTRVLFESVPPSEIGGAVVNIEIIIEIH